MGYNADLQFSITFPTEEALAAVIAVLKEENESEFDDFSVITEALSESADWGNPDDRPLTFIGWGGGKLAWEPENVLKALADAGVTGVIDGIGEDMAKWRWRFAEGEYKEYGGVVIYPEDPYAEAEEGRL